MFGEINKLKEYISNDEYQDAVENASLSSLGTWYLALLDKTLAELSNFDIIRCIRQNIFIDKVDQECIHRMFINGTMLYSDEDCVELVEKLASVNKEILLKYKEQLIMILSNMEKKNLIDKYEFWLYDDEKEEFRESIQRLKGKLEIMAS